MIISASYKTDLPTFYGAWFMNRLREGWCAMLNPYNRRTVRVSLRPEDADAFVFWTRDVRPFLEALREVRRRGFPFVVQHTINGYPRALDRAVADADRAIEAVRRVADEFGPDACVWRYDPIVSTSLTPFDFHRRNFERLAAALRGATDEAVISFAQAYRKTMRNMRLSGEAEGFAWHDPAPEEKRRLAADLAAIARTQGMRLGICAQRELLVEGTHDARCIDADRLARIAGRPVPARSKPHRADCGCFASRDIGEYDTCPHGCAYCYAVRDRAAARERSRRHDPGSPFLFAPEAARGGLDARAPATGVALPVLPA